MFIDTTQSSKWRLEQVCKWLRARSTMTYPRLDVEGVTKTRADLEELPLADHFGIQIADAIKATCNVQIGSKVGGLLYALDLSRADYSEIDRKGIEQRISLGEVAEVLDEIVKRRLS